MADLSSTTLVISHGGIRAVNRRVYAVLKNSGVDVQIVVPQALTVDGVAIELEPAAASEPALHPVVVTGRGPREYWWHGLQVVLDRVRPTTVFLEADTASLSAISVSAWCKRHGAKLICRTAENLSWRPQEAVARAGWRELPVSLVKTMMNLVVRSRVDAVCTVSEAGRRLFAAAGFRRVSAVPMGTDTSKFRYDGRLRRQTRAELKIGSDTTVVAFYGRVLPVKSVETLIVALKGLVDLDWILFLNRFAEQHDYAQSISELITREGLQSRVRWVSASHGGIAQYMVSSDITVLPSRSLPRLVEQFGRVVPEAMACGNLVLVSDSGGAKDLIPSPTQVFPERNSDALARLLRDAMTGPHAELLAERRKAMRHVRKNLSLQAEAAAYARLIEQMAS